MADGLDRGVSVGVPPPTSVEELRRPRRPCALDPEPRHTRRQELGVAVAQLLDVGSAAARSAAGRRQPPSSSARPNPRHGTATLVRGASVQAEHVLVGRHTDQQHDRCRVGHAAAERPLHRPDITHELRRRAWLEGGELQDQDSVVVRAGRAQPDAQQGRAGSCAGAARPR